MILRRPRATSRAGARGPVRRATILVLLGSLPVACTPEHYHREADRVAQRIEVAQQKQALGRVEPFTIETPAQTLRRRLIRVQGLPIGGPASLGSDVLPKPAHWPEPAEPRRLPGIPGPITTIPKAKPLPLTLVESLQIAAQNNRAYQDRKEAIFTAALSLDLAAWQFHTTYSGLLESLLIHDRHSTDPATGVESSGTFGLSKQFETGAILTGNLLIDLANLLSDPRGSSLGVAADASVTIPLMRGAGRDVVTEPVTQAQRDVVYAIWTLERYKRTLAVDVASQYFAVLEQQDKIENAQAYYRRLIFSTRRARRLADAGRLPQLQVDQSYQNEVSARASWVGAMTSYQSMLDEFKVTLGLPPDANIALSDGEISGLIRGAEKSIGSSVSLAAPPPLPANAPIVLVPPDRRGAGVYEMPPEKAIRIALEHRVDLMTVRGKVFDAQRQVIVAANGLEAGVDLVGNVHTGTSRTLSGAGLGSGGLRPSHGFYSAGLKIDLPWERTSERNIYRESYVTLEQSVRDVQDLEDQVKSAVRDELRQLELARENFKIQSVASKLAKRRVDSVDLLLQAGRAEMRDLLEAESALVSAQNALTAAAVGYRVAELELQRDMGVLMIDQKGFWREYTPGKSG